MYVFPAIDLLGGKVVRLLRGDYSKSTVYSADPAAKAEEFAAAGASHLHIVDLDGAKLGAAVNYPVIREIAAQKRVFIQVGGGIRDMAGIDKYLSLGIDRVILGSAALSDPDFLGEALKEYGNAVAVGVDARDGMVAVNGWTEVTDTDSVCFCRQLHERGVSTVIYTDISCDGTLRGTNLKVYSELCGINGLNIIASGGVTFREEFDALTEMGAHGVIVGKAIYDGRLDLKELISTVES